MTEYIFTGIFSAFMESIHIELSNEGVDISVSEIFGEDVILEVIDLFDGKLTTIRHPMDDGLVIFVVEDFETFLDEISDGVID